MDASTTLKPGRYELRGGPGGQYALRQLNVLRRDPRTGRHVYANATGHYAERWQLLASLRVRPAHEVTFYGVIGASRRVWTLV